jgi:hypothetical protein
LVQSAVPAGSCTVSPSFAALIASQIASGVRLATVRVSALAWLSGKPAVAKRTDRAVSDRIIRIFTVESPKVFRKAVMRHSHRHFQFNAVHAIDQFLRVNLLVKEAPELVVDCKHVLQDLASDLLKLVLCDALRGDGAVYGHGWMECW